jgi:hypothetical protein
MMEPDRVRGRKKLFSSIALRMLAGIALRMIQKGI